MSSYYFLYQALQAAQYQVVSILTAVGLVWGGCWLWVDKKTTGTKNALKWLLLAAAVLACCFVYYGSTR